MLDLTFHPHLVSLMCLGMFFGFTFGLNSLKHWKVSHDGTAATALRQAAARGRWRARRPAVWPTSAQLEWTGPDEGCTPSPQMRTNDPKTNINSKSCDNMHQYATYVFQNFHPAFAPKSCCQDSAAKLTKAPQA